MTERYRVLYVVGVKNCGSTMLDAILGNAPGAFSLGEAGGFHRFRGEQTCTCGEPPAACGPCRAVVDAWEADAGVGRASALFEMPATGRCLHWALVRTAARREYARMADLQLGAAAAATGRTVLIDSSKNIGRAAALVLDGGHDVRFVHLVRDPRGHLRSQGRRAGVTRRRRGTGLFAEWVVKNTVISTLLRARAGQGHFLRCRYEDLVLDPAAVLARIGAFAGLDTSKLAAAATGPGVTRTHLFERSRRVDYRVVRIDPDRLRGQRMDRVGNLRFWWSGGFLARLWGYDREQRYLVRR